MRTLLENAKNARQQVCALTTEEKNKALRAAARRGQPHILEDLLNRVGDGEKDPLLLHQAAQNGHPACVKLLLKRGWNVDAIDPFTGLTPLQSACIRGTEAPGAQGWNYDAGNGHAACVKLLMQAGANVHDEVGRKAKALALHGEYPLFDCAGILWNHGMQLSDNALIYPLHRAAECGYPDWVRLLLHGLKADSLAEGGKSPLYTLCNVGDSFVAHRRRHEVCASTLLNAGDKVALQDKPCLLRNGIVPELYRFLPYEQKMRRAPQESLSPVRDPQPAGGGS